MSFSAANFKLTGSPTATDVADLNAALNYLQGSTVAASILQGMVSNGVTINIVHTGVTGDNYTNSANGGVINWDPNGALRVISNTSTNSPGVESPALMLIHEGAHATDPNYILDATTPNAQYDNYAEVYAVGKEDQVGSQLNEVQRFNHQGTNLIESNPSTHITDVYGSNGVLTNIVTDSDSYATVPIAVLSQTVEINSNILNGTTTTTTTNLNPTVPNGSCTVDISVSSTNNPSVVLGDTSEIVASSNSSGSTAIISGKDNTVNLNNFTITETPNSQATVDGTSDNIKLAGNDLLALNSNGNTSTSTITGSGDQINLGINTSVIFSSGSGSDVFYVSSGDSIIASNAIINAGNGEALSITGTGVTLNGSSESLNLNGDGSGAILTGAGDNILIAGNNDTVSSSGNTLNLSSPGLICTVNGTSASSDAIVASGDQINLGSNTAVSVSSTAGDSFYVSNGDSVTATNGTINAGNGASLSITGSGNTLNGSNESVSLGGASTINLAGNADTIGISIGNDVVAGVGETINLSKPNLVLTVDGSNAGGDKVAASNDQINLGSNTSVSLSSGINDVFNASNGDSVNANSSTINAGAGAAISLAGTSNILNGSNNSVNLGNSSGITLTGAAESINASGNNTINLSGNNDSIAGAGNTINVSSAGLTLQLNGTSTATNNVTASGDQINLGSNTAASVSSNTSGNTIFASTGDSVIGSFSTINESNGASLYLAGYNNSVNGSYESVSMRSSGSINVNGSSDSIYGTGETINLAAGLQVNVDNGNYDTINANQSANVCFNGGNDSFQVNGNAAIQIAGSGDTVWSNSNKITMAGSNESVTIDGNNDSVIMSAGSTNDQFIENFTGGGSLEGTSANGSSWNVVDYSGSNGTGVDLGTYTSSSPPGSGSVTPTEPPSGDPADPTDPPQPPPQPPSDDGPWMTKIPPSIITSNNKNAVVSASAYDRAAFTQLNESDFYFQDSYSPRKNISSLQPITSSEIKSDSLQKNISENQSNILSQMMAIFSATSSNQGLAISQNALDIAQITSLGATSRHPAHAHL